MIWRLYNRLFRRLVKPRVYAPEPLPPCGAVAARCCCTKPEGHVERGDPVHQCNPTECTGEWTGSSWSNFRVITMPYPVGPR